MFVQEFVNNSGNHAVGSVADIMSFVGWDAGYMRPFLETDPSHPLRGKVCAIVNAGKRWDEKQGKTVDVKRQFTVDALQRMGRNSPVFVNNATALRKEEWLAYDTAAIEAARYRQSFWPWLMGVNTYSLNGMSKMILEHETTSDVGEAMQDMDGLGVGRNDMPLYQLEGLPLPITYAGWEIGQRKLMISRNTPGTSLDTRMAAMEGARVGELIEKQSIGVVTGLAYGGLSTQTGGYGQTSQIYGAVNFPLRLTYTTVYKPTLLGRTGTGWAPEDLVDDFLAILDSLKLRKQFGEFMVFHSNDWDRYLDADYKVRGATNNTPGLTLRMRLKQIEGISDVQRLDFLFATPPTANRASTSYYGPGGENYNANYPFTLIFIKKDMNTCRAVQGLAGTTLQWESQGGGKLHFKYMCIQAPQFFADYYGNCGVCHANASSSPA